MNVWRTVAQRVRLSIARAVLRLVDDAQQMQSVQVTALAGETRDGVERWQQYGMSAHPHPGAECLLLAIGGNRAHSVVVSVDDRRYRPRDLDQGEVVLYTDEDVAAGEHRIHFKRGREIHLVAGASSIVMTPEGITITAPEFDLNKVVA